METKPVDTKKFSGCSSCGTSSCNKINVFDWLADVPTSTTNNHSNYVEVSFHNASRKEYFLNDAKLSIKPSDLVVVQGVNGFDIGSVSLVGYLVDYQMKKKNVKIVSEDVKKVYRKPTPDDLQKWKQKPEREKEILIKGREMVKTLNLEMKLSSVELQADGKKGIFYFIADNRVDFRELIRSLGNECKLKVEMKQIGARQEASIVGGIGSCGRELCCSTWLTDFKSINTTAARYQNLSINQVKLSGQCGRLKCCLNYELDVYVEAINLFPKNAEFIKTSQGTGKMIKKDIFKKNITYYFADATTHKILPIEEVERILEANKQGISPEIKGVIKPEESKEKRNSNVVKGVSGFNNVESIQLPNLDRRNKKNKSNAKRPLFANNANNNGIKK